MARKGRKPTLSQAEQDERRERARWKFANNMRQRRTEHVLRRIASAYDWSSDDRGAIAINPDYALHEALKRCQLKGHTINGRSINYKQARVIYLMVRKGEYGGLRQDDESAKYLALPGDLKNIQSELNLGYGRPEGCFPEIKPQTMEDCLREMNELAFRGAD